MLVPETKALQLIARSHMYKKKSYYIFTIFTINQNGQSQKQCFGPKQLNLKMKLLINWPIMYFVKYIKKCTYGMHKIKYQNKLLKNTNQSQP